MKYLSLVLALCISLAIPAAAVETDSTGEIQLSVKPVREKTLEVTLVNLQEERTSVSIENLDGTTVYFRDIVKKHNGYRKRLNLNQLEDGKYMLVVRNGKEKQQQVIVIKKEFGMLLSSIK